MMSSGPARRQRGARTRARVWLGIVVTGAFALGGAQAAQATTGYSVASDGDDVLNSIDLETGTATPIGSAIGGDVEGLAFDANGTLFGVDDSPDELITIDTATGAKTTVGPLGVSVTDTGLDFDCDGNLYMSTDVPGTLYELDPAAGTATPIGPQGVFVTGLGFDGDVMYGLTGDNDDRLATMDLATGAATPIGPVGFTYGDGGLAAAADGTLWGILESAAGEIVTFDKATGAATEVSTLGTNAFEGLAIDALDQLCAEPPPTNPADTTAPETTITGKPKNPRPRLTRLRFSSSEPGSKFVCKLDKRAEKACTSPRVYRKLNRGRHKFSVAAIDAAGNRDATPAKVRFRVSRPG